MCFRAALILMKKGDFESIAEQMEHLQDENAFVQQLIEFDPTQVTEEEADKLESIVADPVFNMVGALNDLRCPQVLCPWVHSVL